MCTTSLYTQNSFRLTQRSLIFGKILAEREIISLLNISNLQVFTTEMECVYCAVRVESSNIVNHSCRTSYSSSQMGETWGHKNKEFFCECWGTLNRTVRSQFMYLKGILSFFYYTGQQISKNVLYL
jgi:hypothetical protein